MVKFIILFFLPLSLLAQKSGKFTDERDGASYSWVEIGDHVWMAENLRYTPYKGSYVYSYKEELVDIYGRLYTWETAMTACPTGWHLPDGTEVSELYDHFGGMKKAGAALKSPGTKYWQTPNTGANNRSGFGVLPGGAYSGKLYLAYNSMGRQAYFWTSTEVMEDMARALQFGYNHTSAYDLGYHPKNWALSVRCIKNY